MHWMMWIFWGCLAAVFAGAYLIDFLARGKYSLNKPDKTLNQNLAEAEARRDAGQNDQGGTF